ncbi:MAG TPA: membrane protein insertase YidC [Planctomycetes bacterium]|nr:membrane protein insertase YidC [Planctomycetota bacterium]
MEKRLPLALFLSFLVLFAWSVFFAPPPEQEAEPGQESVAAGETAGGPAGTDGLAGGSGSGAEDAAPSVAEPRAEVVDSEVRELTMVVGEPGTPGYFLATFSNRGGVLAGLKLGDYVTRVGLTEEERRETDNWEPLLEAVETPNGPLGSLLVRTSDSSRELAPGNLDRALWRMEELDDGTAGPGVRFTFGPGTGVVFEKTIRFEPGTWHVLFSFSVRNESFANIAQSAQFELIPAACVPPELQDRFYPEPRVVAVPRDGDKAVWKAAPGLDPFETGSLEVGGDIACVGVTNKYFGFLLREDPAQHTVQGARYEGIRSVSEEEERKLIIADVPLILPMPGVGRRSEFQYTIFAGPKAPNVFAEDFEPYHALIQDSDLGAGFCGLNFNSIGHGLLVVLRWIHAVVGNWGAAIILLTLAVRLALFPINRRSQTAMARYQKKMKRVQPKIDEIKKRYENDPKKLREAQAKIMQEEGAFPPLGGCLPMFLQMPIFFGLYAMLRSSFDLRQQPFAWWITDLSRPDRLLEINLHLPILGNVQYFNLLPILMVVMWVLQQRGMPQPADEQAARMQKMMTFMPILFGLMLYNYAAGLSLYMLTTSTLGIFEQKVIKKVWPIDDTEVERKQASGCGPFAGLMQKMQEKQAEEAKRIEALKRQRKGGKPKRKR